MTGLPTLSAKTVAWQEHFWQAGVRFAHLYNPQRAEGRRTYALSLIVAALLYAALYNGGMALADWEEGVSDEVLIWLAQYPVPFLTNLLLFFTIAATIRRLHDMGWPGAAALLLCLPDPWFILIPLGLLWPSAVVPFGGLPREGLEHTLRG